MATVVAFDLDDTLYAEWDYVRSGYRAVASEIAAATGADAQFLADMMMEYRPRGFEAVLSHIAGMPGSERFTVDSMIESYRAHTPDICLRADACDTIRALAAAGATPVLITDGSTRHQRAKIKALGLDTVFDPGNILISEETGGDKTTPVPWHLVRCLYGAPGSRFFYVGDNISKDFYYPNLGGWTSIMLRDASGNNVFPQQVREWEAAKRPMITIDSLADLKKIILPCL